jgi:hypothetical protein
MARLLVRLDLGPNASPGQFAAVTGDFSALVDLALRWAEIDAREAAARYVAVLDFRELERGRLLVREEDQAVLRAFREAVSMWEDFGQMPPEVWFERVWRRYYRPGKFPRAPLAALSAIGPLAGPAIVGNLRPRSV